VEIKPASSLVMPWTKGMALNVMVLRVIKQLANTWQLDLKTEKGSFIVSSNVQTTKICILLHATFN